MIIEARVPVIGESINEVTLSQWLVEDGDYVKIDQSICEFESDKATLEFPAEKAGKISFVAKEGQDLKIGDLVAKIDTSVEAPAGGEAPAPTPESAKPAAAPAPAAASNGNGNGVPKSSPAPAASGASGAGAGTAAGSGAGAAAPAAASASSPAHASPLAAAIMADKGLSTAQIAQIKGSGPGGRITKSDVLKAVEQGLPGAEAVRSLKAFSREQNTEKTSRLRQTIAKRLVAVKNQTAMLTTFNEVDMGPVMELRTQYKEAFAKKHGVNLGFMSFFTRACCNALHEFPAVNAYLDEKEITFHDYCDISIAVSTPRGLVVPVLRNAESLAMHEIESGIKDLAIRARDGKLSLEEMEGGTFTITNGGVFGSLMSTPIINSPQSAILGMHKIEDRPVAVNGQVVIRSMMYLALSYDHRIIDGKESVSFLVRVKEQLENPEQLLFGKDPVELLLEL
jgi:2-oxoglutarate dehydrogenase E2 component (dihydrolipoamide succinyltransferase)